MSESFAFIFLGGKKKIDVTSLTLVNNTDKNVKVTVPAGKRWLLINIKITNPDNVIRIGQIAHYKETALTNAVKSLLYKSMAANEVLNFPSYSTDTGVTTQNQLLILDEGETLSFNWYAGGASAGGTDADGIVVEYLEIDL